MVLHRKVTGHNILLGLYANKFPDAYADEVKLWTVMQTQQVWVNEWDFVI
jgi:hypothetical protein